MYFKELETSALNKSQYNDSMKKIAADRLKVVAAKKKLKKAAKAS